MDFRSNLAALGIATVAALLMTLPSPAASRRITSINRTHRIAIVEGEAQAGHAFERPIGNGLTILLDPIISGWVLRIVPAPGPRGSHDYAELATPPYQSVNPLLISTDFNFRAQDALAWNPRRFRFAANPASFAELSAAYDRYQHLAASRPVPTAELRLAESHLADLVSNAPEGELTILDAHLVQGTANQTQAAAMVALHPNASARQVDQPANGVATSLGRINWLRFRIRLDLPTGSRVEKSLHIDRASAL